MLNARGILASILGALLFAGCASVPSAKDYWSLPSKHPVHLHINPDQTYTYRREYTDGPEERGKAIAAGKTILLLIPDDRARNARFARVGPTTRNVGTLERECDDLRALLANPSGESIRLQKVHLRLRGIREQPYHDEGSGVSCVVRQIVFEFLEPTWARETPLSIVFCNDDDLFRRFSMAAAGTEYLCDLTDTELTLHEHEIQPHQPRTTGDDRNLPIAPPFLRDVTAQPTKPMPPPSIPNTVDYVETPSRDLPQTKAFFTALLGWRFTEYGPDYLAFEDGRLNGGFYRSDKVSSYAAGSSLIVIYTERLEELRDRAKTLGASITRDIFSFPGGRRFHFTEPGGSEFAIWSDK